MGLTVASELSALGNWMVHILDIDKSRGEKIARETPRVVFHRADVTNYASLSKAFQSAFAHDESLDFVFANAGVIERFNYYAHHPVTDKFSPPPEPDLLSIDADLKGVILTTYLSQHYLRVSPHKGIGSNIVMTASCGGLYPSYYSPLYSAAKCKVTDP